MTQYFVVKNFQFKERGKRGMTKNQMEMTVRGKINSVFLQFCEIPTDHAFDFLMGLVTMARDLCFINRSEFGYIFDAARAVWRG